MKQLIKLLILVSALLLPTNYLLAEGHSGSYDLKAYFTGSASSNGSPQQGFTANYEGMVIAVDVEGSSSIFNKSSHHCVGSISMVAGKGTEKATCKIALADSEDGEFIFFHIDSVFPAPDGIKKGKFVGGTGKYKNFSGDGITIVKPLPKLASSDPSMRQSVLILRGSYSY